jgi:hypothetical protein
MEDLDPRDVAQQANDRVRGRAYVHKTLLRLVEEARATVGDDADLITEMVLQRLANGPAPAEVDREFTLMQLEPIAEDVVRARGWTRDPDTGLWRRPLGSEDAP